MGTEIRHTAASSVRLFLDPNSSVQGRGFWTGKFSPEGNDASTRKNVSDQARLSAFQERGEEHDLAMHFEEPPEDEETIKALSNEALFEKARVAHYMGDSKLYQLCKADLERRAYMAKVRKALSEMAKAAERGGPRPRSEAQDSMQANRDKRVFLAIHGEDDETTREKPVKPSKVRKAIGTKPSEKRERPVKRAKPTTKAKVSSTKSGKKNYDYRKPSRKPAAKKAPSAAAQPEVTGDGPTIEVQPQKLADQLSIPIEKLHKLAEAKTEHEFVTYFRAKGSAFLRKHKVSDTYLQEVYGVLHRQLMDKSFTVNPSKLKKGSEEREFAEGMKVSGVNTLPKLATFLARGYGLSKSQASEMARELHAVMKEEGALL